MFMRRKRRRNHVEFVVVVDLNDSSIFDEFLEYVDLINVYLEIILHLLIEMMKLNYLKFQKQQKINKSFLFSFLLPVG